MRRTSFTARIIRTRGLPRLPAHLTLDLADPPFRGFPFLQGTDLGARPGAFKQVLLLLRDMRRHTRHIEYLGLTRTGLSTVMVRRISLAISQIRYKPAVHIKPARLELQKVSRIRLPLPHRHEN